MKKIIMSAGLVTALAVSSAQADPFTGVYGGLQLGWQQHKIKPRDRNLDGTSYVLRAKGNTGLFPFGFHIGMASCSASKIYMAGEFGMDMSTKTTIKTFTPYLAGKVGLKLGERVVTYVGAEVNLTRFDLKRGTGNVKTNKFGFGPLMGVGFGVTDKIMLGLEYKYRKYASKIRYKALGRSTTYIPSSNEVMARLSMKLS